jgi:tetratricopeptide (TPR) repeat protein
VSAVADSALDAARRAEHLRLVGRLAEAEDVARAALAQSPQDPALLNALAGVLYAAGRHGEGLEAADALVAAWPEGESGHRLRSMHLLLLGRHDEAVLAGYACVTLRPDDAAAAGCYASALQAAGRLADALQVAQRVVRLDPTAASSHLLLADIASGLRDPRSRDIARSAYEQALGLDPDNAVARHDLAVLDSRSHRPACALAGLVDAGRMDPALPDVLCTVAAVLWQLSWHLRMFLLVATLVMFGVGTSPTGARIAAALTLAGAAGLTWWAGRDLPRGTLPVARAALRTDRPLAATWLTLATCLLVQGAVLVTGLGLLAALTWLVLGALGALALVVRLRRR